MSRSRLLSSLSERPFRLVACLASFIACLLFATAAHARSDAAVPDWVRAAAASALPRLASDTPAVVLLDDTVLTVTPNGKAVEHHRRVVRILRPKGRDDAIVFLPFSPEEKLSDLHVWSIGPDGHEYALKDKEVGEIGYPGGGNFYADIRVRVVTAPGSDPGGVVAFEFDQAVPAYLNEVNWFFQSTLPTLSTSYAVNLPEGFTYTTVFAHHAPVSAVDLEHGRSRWQLSNVPAVDLNELSFTPAPSALDGRMALRFSGPGVASIGNGWPGIGDWYSHLSSSRLAASPEISTKARDLAGSTTDFYDRVEPIAEFVQKQVRYFVIERGIGGLQPHPAAEIFRNRFGDCKDKATLLVTMLGSVGVHADLLMVDSSRGAIDPEAPSLYGNHMISAIEIPAGYQSPRLRSVVALSNGKRFLIFDPTSEKTPFGQLEHDLQGSYALLAEGPASQVIALPTLAPDLNRLRRSASFRLSADGTLQGTVTESRFGDAAVESRYVAEGLDDAERTRRLDTELARDLPQFSLSGLKLENVSSLNKDLITTYQISAEHFARSAGALLFVRPRVLGSEHLLRILHDRASRPGKVPYDLRETHEEHDEFTIDLPEGFTAEELPEAVTLDVGFASYTSSTTLVGHTLRFTRTYTVRELTLDADRGSDLRRLAETIATDEQSTAVLKKL